MAAAGGWLSAEQPGSWAPVERSFRDGHTAIWGALEGWAGPYGPSHPRRLVIATFDPATLPEAATWHLETTLPADAADLVEIVRLYGLRNWVEQAYKRVKGSLGWSQYQVRSDTAMRRHCALVQCAFAFCWWAELHGPPQTTGQDDDRGPSGQRGGKKAAIRDPAWPQPPRGCRRCWTGSTRVGPSCSMTPREFFQQSTDRPT